MIVRVPVVGGRAALAVLRQGQRAPRRARTHAAVVGSVVDADVAVAALRTSRRPERRLVTHRALVAGVLALIMSGGATRRRATHGRLGGHGRALAAAGARAAAALRGSARSRSAKPRTVRSASSTARRRKSEAEMVLSSIWLPEPSPELPLLTSASRVSRDRCDADAPCESLLWTVTELPCQQSAATTRAHTHRVLVCRRRRGLAVVAVVAAVSSGSQLDGS